MNQERLNFDKWVNQTAQTLHSFDLFPSEVSQDVTNSLSKKLWPFQEAALLNLEFIWSSQGRKMIEQQTAFDPRHLLFNMATGTGKTLLIAASILEAYKLGYQRVLFFVSRKNIVSKTIDNLTNNTSLKYMFSEAPQINGQMINFKVVDVYDDVIPSGEIQIIFQTVNGLHSLINDVKENTIPLDVFSKNKILMIADEAHHLSGQTLSKSDKEIATENKHWEESVNLIFEAGENQQPNLLLEFSATIDWMNDDIAEKYWNKILFQYDLPKFMNDGYSKTVRRIETGLSVESTMLNAVLLSQYRKDLAFDEGLQVKPVVLFKSNNIVESQANVELFKNMIESLSISVITNHFNILEDGIAEDSILRQVIDYYASNEESIGKITTSIKQDFAPANIIDMNDDRFEALNLKLVNTMDNPLNKRRVVFNVDKLNEGWDVLNLFDIARLGNVPDVKVPKKMPKQLKNKTYQQEAQLIGRGARLYRFDDNDKRIFDGQKRLEPLERVYYHTSNKSGYVAYLVEALRRMGVESSVDGAVHTEKVILRDAFKKSSLYQHGYLLVNDFETVDSTTYRTLSDYGLTKPVSVQQVQSMNDANFDEASQESETKLISFDGSKISDRIWLKAIHMNPRMRFSFLKSKMHDIDGLSDVIVQIKELKIDLVTNVGNVGIPSDAMSQLAIANQVVDFVANTLSKTRANVRGLKTPMAKNVKEVFADYEVEVDASIGVDELYDLERHKKQQYFSHTRVVMDSYEHSLVDRFEQYIEVLKRNGFTNVWLIRNDEHFNKLGLVDLDGNGTFMPDFVLYFEKKQDTGVASYEMFLEPKGEYLADHDRWKEKLLELFRDDEEIHSLFDAFEEGGIKVSGTKFYSPNDAASIRQMESDLKAFTEH